MRVAAFLAGWILLCAGTAAAQEAEGGCVGKARLRGPLWDSTNATLEPGLEIALDEIARTIVERCDGKDIVIEAHAFELPSAELNQRLAELRVTLLVHELVKRGVPSARLLPVALGETRPLVAKDTPGAALQNRRITFGPLD